MNGEEIQQKVDSYADAFEKAKAKLGNAELYKRKLTSTLMRLKRLTRSSEILS